jgi:hypothetical protein
VTITSNTGSVKPNKTRLGKLMSKAANTLGTLSVLSPKRPVSSSDRHSLSHTAASAAAVPATRSSLSAARPTSARSRPESLPISRQSGFVAPRRPSSSRTVAAPAPASIYQTASNAPSDEDVSDTWRNVGASKRSVSNSDSELDATVAPPVAVAQNVSPALPTG